MSVAMGGEEWEGLSYYDRLRLEGVSGSAFSEERPESSVALVIDDKRNETYRMAHLASFLPFSNKAGVRSGMHNVAAAALLAIHHFNNKDSSPVPQLHDMKDCNVRLTMEFIDSKFDPLASTSILLYDVLPRRENRTLENPPPAALVGAYRSAVTSPLAILSGVNDMLQVSSLSTASDFENKAHYPYFGRTCPSAYGEAQVAVDYYNFLSSRLGKPVRYVAVLFVSDNFGSAVQKAFQDFASNDDIETVSYSFSYSSDPSEIVNAVEALVKSEYRYFYVVCFVRHYPVIMEEAHKQGITGDDYFWLFHGPGPPAFQRNLRYPRGELE